MIFFSFLTSNFPFHSQDLNINNPNSLANISHNFGYENLAVDHTKSHSRILFFPKYPLLKNVFNRQFYKEITLIVYPTSKILV